MIYHKEWLTIEVDDAVDVVLVKPQVRLVTAIEWSHDGVLVLGMSESERVSQFVRSDLEQIGA